MQTRNPKVLIVEDELLISSLLERQLEHRGYRVVGNAISYLQAVELYHETSPDIILIDIRLSGEFTGLDFGRYLRAQPSCPPFVYLTAQLDRRYLEEAKQTLPAGYLNKPIQLNSLMSTIEVALYRQQQSDSPPGMLILKDQGVNHFVRPDDILYLQIEHVYVNTYLLNGRQFVERSTLTDFLQQLGRPEIVQTHRSYAANLNHVASFEGQELVMGKVRIPVSRQRKREVLRRVAEVQRKKS